MKVEKIVIRTEFENYMLEKYNKFKTALKELTNSCSFIWEILSFYLCNIVLFL